MRDDFSEERGEGLVGGKRHAGGGLLDNFPRDKGVVTAQAAGVGWDRGGLGIGGEEER